MDSIPHPFQSLIQELQTDSRRVSVEVVPNYSILKGKKCLMISMRNYLSVYCGSTTSVVQLRLTGTKSQAQQRKLSVTAGQAFQVVFEWQDLQRHVEVPCTKEKSVLGWIKFFQVSGHLDLFLQFGPVSIFPASGTSLCNSQQKHISICISRSKLAQLYWISSIC